LIDLSHNNTDLGAQIPFLGSEGLFSPFWPLKPYKFFIYIKLPIDGYVTRPYWFWAPNSVFGLWRLIFAQKYIFFLLHVKFPIDRYVTQPYWFWAPNYSEGQFLPFWPLKVYIFFIYIKFPIDWWVTWPISFFSLPVPNLGIRRIPNFFGLRNLQKKRSPIFRLNIFNLYFLYRLKEFDVSFSPF
jgi:hypothetical protein